MHDGELGVSDRDLCSVADGVIYSTIGVDDLPEHGIIGVKKDGSAGLICQISRRIDVIIVAMSTNDCLQLSTAEAFEDGAVVMSGIDNDCLVVVANDPDIVLYFVVAAVKAEYTGGDDVVKTSHVGRSFDLMRFGLEGERNG